MKKITITSIKVFFGMMFLLTVGCSGYTKKDGKIFLRWSNEAHFRVNYSELEGADYETFTEIENNTETYISKDKDHVFVGASILNGADPKTFEQIKDYYWRDSKNVFLLQFGVDNSKIKAANPATFQLLDDNLWAKDKNNIYYSVEKLNFANKDKFTVINENWGKDDKSFFWQESKLDSIDYNSAVIPSPDSYYIKDKKNVYFKTTLVVGCDPATFVVDGDGSFGHDKTNMFSSYENQGLIDEQYKQMYINKK